MSTMTTTQVTATTVNFHRLGTDVLDLMTDNITDLEVLVNADEAFPKGLNLMGSNAGPVYVWPAMLLALAQPDGFGLELQGLAHSAAELLRLATDPCKCEELGGAGVDRMINLFTSQARGQSVAQRPNQLHRYRWGVGVKIVASDRVEPGTIEIHPTGNV